MHKREEVDWDKPIFLATVIICIITISKIVFWVDIACIAFGIGWYLKARKTKAAKNALLLLAVSLLILPLTYFIGYRLEQVEMFKDLGRMFYSIFLS